MLLDEMSVEERLLRKDTLPLAWLPQGMEGRS